MTCGPGTFGDWLVPDRIGPVTVTDACTAHDKAYESHATSRKVADAQFHRDLLVAGSDLVGSVGRSFRRWAWIYWAAVRLFGKLAWWRAGK